jgi:glycosyltransferase involved in cell wall biosynthesis
MCLTADRQKLTDRAVRCFQSQTYENRHLLIYDTGVEPYDFGDRSDKRVIVVRDEQARGKRIGALRNLAARLCSRVDIIAHWDSDDWSHPERIAVEARALTGQQCVGFHNLLFFDSRERNEAWEYDYRYGGVDRFPLRVLGTSLMYWRDTWVKRPFDEDGVGEDHRWFDNSVIVPAQLNGVMPGWEVLLAPMMIAEFHGGNTNAYGASHEPHFKPIFDRHEKHANPEWRRAPEWDLYCREVMK